VIRSNATLAFAAERQVVGRTEMRLLLLLAIEVVVGCAGAPPSSTKTAAHVLTEEEAVARAEEFVRVNGYVRREDADPQRMQLERSLTYGTTPEELLPHRAGTLLPRACGVLAEAVRGFDHGWSVVFCFNPANPVWPEVDPTWRKSIRERSRVVVMDVYGADMFIPHPDFGLTGPGIKRLPGLDDFERLMGAAAQPGIATDGASPRR
jgi:hypothetical protein